MRERQWKIKLAVCQHPGIRVSGAYSSTMPKARIFIAEDDEAVTREITTDLERLGYLIVGRADRSEATLQLVKELLPDLVLMEIDLQGQLNSVEVGKQIHTDFDIPVIFISAHANTMIAKSATH